MSNNIRPSREIRLKLVRIVYKRAKQEPCPYCKGLDIGYSNLWLERTQRLNTYATEPNPFVYINEPQKKINMNYIEYPNECDNFKILICANCGFTKFFRYPPC